MKNLTMYFERQKARETERILPSHGAPGLVKVLEKVAAAHWVGYQMEVQYLPAAPMDNGWQF